MNPDERLTSDRCPRASRYHPSWVTAGDALGYVRVVGRRRAGVALSDPIVSVPTQYMKAPIARVSG